VVGAAGAPGPAGARPGPAAGRAERVRVVDDDPLPLQFVCTTLEEAGYRVQAAAGGAEALGLYTAAAEPFRLVLSDVVMPQMSGIDLARRLRQPHPQGNLVFLSSPEGDAAHPDDPAVRARPPSP